MLRTSSRTRSWPRALRACLVAMLALSIPGAAQALSTTLDLVGPDVSVTATFDDGIEPGSVVLTLDLEPSIGIPGVPLPSLTGFFLVIDDNDFPPIISTGTDVFESGYFASSKGPNGCPCFSITELGNDGILDPTGISSTTIQLSQASASLDLVGLGGVTFFVALHVPDAPGGRTLVKLRGTIPVVPEPTTAVMMLLGLIGLAGGSQRLAKAPA